MRGDSLLHVCIHPKFETKTSADADRLAAIVGSRKLDYTYVCTETFSLDGMGVTIILHSYGSSELNQLETCHTYVTRHDSL